MEENGILGDLAIVGMSCRLPGADGLSEYWELIRNAGCKLGPLPESRLNRRLYFDEKVGTVGKSYTDIGGIVSPRPVDYGRLPLPDDLIEGRDPAHLMLCEVAADAVRDAGYDPFALPNRNAGVYIGHTGGSVWVSDILYSTVVAEGAQYLLDTPLFQGLGTEAEQLVGEVVTRTRRAHQGRKPKEFFDLGALAASALISKAFGLNGPYMVVDAACASSMQAMAVGIRALQQGRIDMALVGGASYCKSDSLVLFSAAQSVSSKRSCPFGESADGLVSSEGFVVLAVKTVERAVADRDRIHAVIRGVGVSSDGKGKSLWAPRKEGQQLAVLRAYGRGVDATGLHYIEAHATSTQVGDATEIKALSEVLHQLIPEASRKIAIGSSKGNVGHTLETAGMAGLVKTVLAMQHGIIPPAVGDGKLNSEIEWEKCPFYIPFQEEPWPMPANGAPRRAAVNAFGIGGLNVHVVLDQFLPSATRSASRKQAPVGSASAGQDDRAIAIVGAGCILPGALTLSAFWDLLESGRDPKTTAPESRWNSNLYYQDGDAEVWKTYNTVGGYITDFEYDWRRHRVPPKQIASANPLQFMLLDAADQALSDAGYDTKQFDGKRTAVVVGTVFGSDFSNQLQMGLRLPEFEETLADVLREKGVQEEAIRETAAEYKDLLLKRMPALLDETGSFTSSTLASRITKAFNLMGGALAMDAGACSAHFALQAAVDMLLDRTSDVVLCAAGQRSMDMWVYESLALGGMLSHGNPRSAFDAEADGFVPGEGCGVVVLKRLSDARRDGDRIRGVIRGIGAGRDDDVMAAMESATRRGLADAGIAADKISMVEAGGLGLAEIDHQELAALGHTLCSDQRDQPLAVGSLRAQIGDTGGGAGMAALLKGCLALEHGLLPGTVGFSQPSLALQKLVGRVQVSSRPVKLPAADEDYCAAGILSYHDDMAYQVIVDNGLQPPTGPAAPATEQSSSGIRAAADGPEDDWRIVRFASTDRAGMVWQLDEALNDPQSTFQNAHERIYQPNDRLRVAVVTESAEALARQLQLARGAVSDDPPWDRWQSQGITIVDRIFPRRKVAALFPGQGSQYAGMLQELCQISQAAHDALNEALAVMASHGFDRFDEFAWQHPETLGKDIWHTQVGMLVADYIAFRAATELGFKPDYVGGHSYGEFPSLLAAGAWDLEETMLATRSRCEALLSSKGAHTTMLSVLAHHSVVEQLLAEQDGEVWLCAINGPDQTGVGGTPAAVGEFAKLCTDRGLKSRQLRVPCAFHTPLLNDTQEPLAEALRARKIQPPTTPIISSTCASFLADPERIREALVHQMTHPVRYQPMVQRLYDLGVRVFVEIGPSQVLTQLNRRILNGLDDVYMTAMDHQQQGGRKQLARFQAMLEALELLTPNRAVTTRPGTPLPRQVSPAIPDAIEPAPAAFVAMEPAPAAPGVAVDEPQPAQPPVIFFDATVRRRTRHRSAARSVKPSDGVSASRPSEPTTSPRDELRPLLPTKSHVNGNGNGAVKHDPSPGASRNGQRHQDTSQPSGGRRITATAPRPAKAAAAGLDLQSFLIQFVVEQTGYPSEIVELDADLEADLGIDSIKKAQMFGEIGEQFGLQRDENEDLSLDDFPTLRDVLSYLEARPEIAASSPQAMAVGRPTAPPASPAPTSRASASPARPSPALAVASPQQALANVAAVTDTADAERPPIAQSRVPVEPALRPDKTAVVGDLESFLIEFVVEQTGYPAEIVELDADLEADLGIDSIKKAQMFGEIGEHFQIEADESLSLDDFPTLQHVLDYLHNHPQVQQSAAGNAAAGAAVTINRAAAHEETLRSQPAAVTSTPVASTPVASTPVVSTSAPEPAADAAPQTATAAAEQHQELAYFLINFVVEQTGYPPEIVELDADLEADLGIDSIKKAQMFGEIGEHFQIEADENLSLDDFPTLAHVLAYLDAHGSAGTDPPSVESVVGESQLTATAVGSGRAAVVPPLPTAPKASSDTKSSPAPLAAPASREAAAPPRDAYELGMQRGRKYADSIRRLLRRHSNLIGPAQSAELASTPFETRCSPAELEELRGMADGAGVMVNSLAALNMGLGRTGLLPCGSQWACQPASESAGFALRLDAGVPLTIDVRQVAGGPDCAIVTLPGLLGALAGVNSRGVIVALGSGPDGAVSAARPSPIGLQLLHILQTASSSQEATHLATGQQWPSNLVLTIGQFGEPAIQMLRCHDDGGVDVQEREGRVATDALPDFSVSGTPQQALAQAESVLAEFALLRPTALRGADPAHWLALAVDGQSLLAVVGDEARLAGNAPAERISAPFKLIAAQQLEPRVKQLAAASAARTRSVAPADAVEPDASKPITQRYVLRLIEVPRPPKDKKDFALTGPVLLLGDNSDSRALQAELERSSILTTIMPTSDDPAEVAADVEKLSVLKLPRTIVVMTARDEPLAALAAEGAWQHRRSRGVIGPFLACQQWLARIAAEKLVAGSSLVAVTALGGDFGLSGDVTSAEGGAVAGLLKGIRNEYPDLRVRVIDAAPALSGAELARQVQRELSSGDGEIEVALHPGARLVVRPAPQAGGQLPKISLPQPGSVWLVTGGARGVTAAVARELGRRFGLRLQLVGTTPLEQVEPAWLSYSAEQLKALRGQIMIDARNRGENAISAWNRIEKTLEISRNLTQMQADGLDVAYHVCDISDRTALASLLVRIRRQAGPIAGILHGAGFEAAARFERKQLANVQRTIAAKNDGAAALIELTSQDAIEYFIGFGSTSGRLGGIGQTDYSMANEMLAKQVDQLRYERSVRATVFHWHAWDEIGMAARPESKFALESFGLHFMPPREGIEHLIGELEAGLPESEVLITEPKLCPVTVSPQDGIVPAAVDVPQSAPSVPEDKAVTHQPATNNKAALAAAEVDAPQAAATAPASSPIASTATIDWEEFLVNFVVEQTGYPPEIVELDVDLEADLGIDSIKKAQLFGEIGEQFGLQADESLSLDDFPTLRHVMAYLDANVSGGGSTASATPTVSDDSTVADSTAAVDVEPRRETESDESPLVLGPLLDRVEIRDGVHLFHSQFDPTQEVFLLEHRLFGRPVLPAVVSLELLAEAAVALQGQGQVNRFKDVVIHKALRFMTDDVRDVRLAAQRADDAWQMKLTSDFYNRRGQLIEADRLHVAGKVELDATPSPLIVPYSEPRFSVHDWPYFDESPVYHGPTLRQLKSLLLQRDGGYGYVNAPDPTELAGQRDGSGWLVHSALLDGCLVAVGVYLWLMCEERMEIPGGFGNLELLRQPLLNETCLLRFILRDQTERESWFDLVLFGEDESPILQCRSLCGTVVSQEDRQ